MENNNYRDSLYFAKSVAKGADSEEAGAVQEYLSYV